VTNYAYIYLADLLREWNDIDSARAHMEQGIALCSQWGEPQLLASGYAKLARLLQTVGDADGAREAMQKATETADSLSTWYAERIAADHVCLLLAQEDTVGASQVAASSLGKVDVEARPEIRNGKTYRALARLALAQGDLDQALSLQTHLASAYQAAGGQGLVVESLVLRAVILWARQERPQALDCLARALALAEPEGYVRTFVDEGAPMGALLQSALEHGVAVDYVRKLLAAQREETIASSSTARPSPAYLALVEPLSERELDVLRLLRTDLSSTEIAETLYISRHTARTHIAHIYSKLDVHSRADAIGRAEELGLL
jgi:LuxR family maltose regulon positive regulatory protein